MRRVEKESGDLIESKLGREKERGARSFEVRNGKDGEREKTSLGYRERSVRI